MNAADLDVVLEPLPRAEPADPLLRLLGEQRGDLGAPGARLFLGRHRDVHRHPPLERAPADVEHGHHRERDQREHRDHDEHHQVGRDDDVVDPAPARTCRGGGRRAAASCTWRVAGVKPTTAASTTASRSGGRTERYVTSYSFESCWPISSKIGSRAAGLALSAYRTAGLLRDRLQRGGVVLLRLQADREHARVRLLERRERLGDRLPSCRRPCRPRGGRRSSARAPRPSPSRTPLMSAS